MRPNILFFFPDQLRPDWLGLPGMLPIRTPNLRRLAETGTCFTNAVTPSPLCAPARACLAARAGADQVFAVDASDAITLAEETVARSALMDRVAPMRADFATPPLDAPLDVVVMETFGAFPLAVGAGPDLQA